MSKNVEAKSKSLSKIDKELKNNFLALVQKGRTKREITTHLKIDDQMASILISASYRGYEYSQKKNIFNETVHFFLKKSDLTKTKKRIFSYKWQKDGDPYLLVELPNEQWKKAVIVPLADLCFGSKSHNSDKFKEYISWIARSDNVFTFFNGDILEPVPRLKGMPKEEYDYLKHADLFIKLIKPIAHKVLWAQSGEKEEKVWKSYGVDPLWYVCENYKIPYRQTPLFVDIFWQKYLFTFFCFHGRTAAINEGTKLNAAMRPLVFQEHTMFTVMGHAQNGMADEIMRECQDSENFNIVRKTQWIVICPSFIDYFETDAFKKGYSPPASGTISCRLYPDGSYGVSS